MQEIPNNSNKQTPITVRIKWFIATYFPILNKFLGGILIIIIGVWVYNEVNRQETTYVLAEEVSEVYGEEAIPEEVVQDEIDWGQPIHNVFYAWENKDIDSYANQWSEYSRQILPSGKIRTKSEIIARASKAFDNYNKIDASWRILNVAAIHGLPDRREITVLYTMIFEKTDGSTQTENDIMEVYIIDKDEVANVLKIIENRDYIKKYQ